MRLNADGAKQRLGDKSLHPRTSSAAASSPSRPAPYGDQTLAFIAVPKLFGLIRTLLPVSVSKMLSTLC
ncbi:MAG: hypothetical protein JWM32_450 [Verrucomicrobia bacterium]|nr:hypothetical protein [Verrucomicrobiota bacterium]